MIAKNCQHKLRTGVFTLSLFWLGLSAYAPLAAQRANSRDFIPGDKANPESSTRNYYSQSDNRSPIIVDPNIVKARFDSVDRPELDSRTSKSVEANSVDYSTPWRYQLKTLNHEQFESKLAQIWGDRLRAEILDSNNRVARIFFPEGRMAPESSMRFDRATGLLTYEGDPSRKKAWYELMSAIDRPVNPYEKTGVGIIDVSFADPGIVGQISAVIQDQEDGRLQVPIENLNEEVLEALTTQDIPDLKGPIRVRRSAETNTLIIEGDEEDVAKVKKFLDEFLQDTKSIDRIAKPIQLYNATPEDLQSRIQEIYDNQFANIHGPASVTAIAATNSLLVAGQKSAVEELENLIRQIDGEKKDPADVEMDDKKLSLREKGYKKFFLEHISAIEADRAVRTLFAQNTTGGSQSSREPQPVDVYADVRNNTLVVIASPTLIRRAQALIDELDQRPPEENRNRRVVRVFQIRNHNAADFRVILQDTLNGGEQQNISNIAEGNLQSNNQQLNQLDNANNSVTPVTPFSDVQFQRDNGTLSAPVNLFDVRITSDAASNQITVKAPEDAMEVIAEIIERLDRLPELVSEVKVFPIVNGDASEVIATLNQIFNGQQQGGGVGNQTSSLTDLPLQSPGSDGASLINIRFAVSQRTNTVIAVGSQSDLEFVESLVYRLDEENIQDRQTKIFRLSNLNVQDVAAAIQTFLDSQVTNNQSNPLTGAGQDATGVNLYRREVIVVEEATSNHLIVNARPEYMEQIEFLINNLDRRPPMVKIKAMIATVSLDQLENFGVEFGIQESDIFGAGLADTIGTGFVGLDNVGGQLLSNLGVGRASNNAGGVSGLVLSAGDESLNFVMRFLQQKGCANILFAPQIMTVENLTGSLFQGSEIQRLGGISQNAVTSQQDVEDVPVGIQLDVTPRVAPDGMIVMTVDVRNDSLGSVADGTVIGVDLNGNQIFSRPINRTIAQTAIMARSGQTVVISGLIQEEKSQTVTSVPFLGKLPVIGPLFQNIENTADRSELMVFITPYLVDDPEDISAMNEDDFSRMHWCKCDVAEAYGTTSYTGAPYSEQYPKVIYPQVDPLGSNPVFQEEADVNSEQELGLEPMDSVEEMMPPANDRWKNRGNGSGTRNADPFPERIEPQGSSSRSSRPEFNQAFGQQSRQRRLPNDFDYQQIERTNQPSYVDQRQGRVLPEYTARREMIDGRANFQSNQYRSDTFENFEDARSSDRRSGTRYRFSEGDESPSARNARHSYGGRETISVPMKKPRFILHN